MTAQSATDGPLSGRAVPAADRRLDTLALLVVLLPGALGLSVVRGTVGVLYGLLHGIAVFAFAAGAAWLFRSETRTVAVSSRDALLVLFVLLIPATWLGNPLSFASLQPFAFWLEGLVFYLLLTAAYRDGAGPEPIERLLVALSLCVASSGVLRALFPDAALAVRPYTPFTFDANTAATLLVPGLFVGLHRLANTRRHKSRAAWLALLGLLLADLALTDSRAVWLGFAASGVFGMLVYSRDTVHSSAAQCLGIKLRSRRICLALLGLFWTGSAVFLATLPFWFSMIADVAGESIGGRLRRWANGVMMVYHFFPFGVGAGNWLDQFPRFRGLAAADPAGLLSPFNTILQLAAEGGVLLVMAFAVLVSERLAGEGFRGRALFIKCALLCLLIASFFHISFLSNTIVLIWAVVLLLAAGGGARSSRSVRLRVRTIAVVCVALSGAVLTFKLVATWGSIRSAVIVNHLVYMDDRPAFSFESRVRKLLPGPVLAYLEDVDYRKESPDTLPAGRFATGFLRSTYSVIGSREAAAGRCAAAEKWFHAALRRNPNDVRAKTGLCECSAEFARWTTATKQCTEAVALAPGQAAAHENLGLALQQQGNWQGALDQLHQARRLVDANIGDYQFGRPSVPLISGYLRQRRHIEEQLGTLYSSSPLAPDRSEELGRIAEVPEVHKSLTLYAGRVLLSNNEAGRYDLWQIDGNSGAAKLLTNDSLDPFRLSVGTRNRALFFVSDRLGDYHYSLYAMNLFQRKPWRIAPSESDASVAEYAVSPDGRYVAYKEERGHRRRLVVQRLATGRKTRVPGLSFDYGKPTWSDDSARLAFVSGPRTVGVYAIAENKLLLSMRYDAKIIDLAFAPSGGELWVLERNPDESARLDVLDVATGAMRVINTDSRRLVTVHPTGKRQLLIREFVGDRYLMRSFDTVRGVWAEAGPSDGVSYAPVVDRFARKAYYLHTGTGSPIELLALDLDTLAWHSIHRFSSLSPKETTPFARIPLDEAGGASYYFYEPEAATGMPVVIWLHGSSSSFSPRWHKYAQYFTRAGFAFAALNFSGSTGVPRPDLDRSALHQLQAKEVHMLVDQIRSQPRYRDSPVVALGVSYGTLLVDFTLSRYPDIFDAVVEYSPLVVPRHIPAPLPYLAFAGENDAYADIAGIRAAFAKSVPHRTLRVFADEGHDLRHRRHIVERLEKTAAFIGSLRRGTR